MGTKRICVVTFGTMFAASVAWAVDARQQGEQLYAAGESLYRSQDYDGAIVYLKQGLTVRNQNC